MEDILKEIWEIRQIVVVEKNKISDKMQSINNKIKEKESLLERLENKSQEDNKTLARTYLNSNVSDYDRFISPKKEDIKLNCVAFVKIIDFRNKELYIDELADEISELKRQIERLALTKLKYKILSDKIWFNTILHIKGNIQIEKKDFDKVKRDYTFHLETGEVFQP